MKPWMLTMTGALGLWCGAAQAQEPPICDAVLVAFAEARLQPVDGPASALRFLREETTLRDGFSGSDVSVSGFLPPPGGDNAPVDISTTGAFQHEGCIQVTGKLMAMRNRQTLMRPNGQPVPVSMFFFDRGAFAKAFEPGPDIQETNARLKVGSLGLLPEMFDPDSAGLAPDPFPGFSLSAYIAQDRNNTLTGSYPQPDKSAGDHQWFGLDLRQGKGRQLVAVACDRPCQDYLDDYKLRLLAASGPAATVVDPVPASDPAPAQTDPKPNLQPLPKSEITFDGFEGEDLTIVVLSPEGEVVSEDRINLAAKAVEADWDAGERLRMRAALGMIMNETRAVSDIGLQTLIGSGWLDAALRSHEVQSAERGYRIVLRAPKPPELPRLTGVDLVLDQAKGNAIYAYCTLLAEITHPEHDPVVLGMEINFNGAELDAEGNEIYGRLSSNPAQQDLIPDVPYDELGLRLFARPETKVVGSAPARPSSCALDWAGYFPETLLPLSDLAAGTDLPVIFDVNNRVVVAGATLRGTARPVFAMVYNVIGLQDSNGALLDPTLYPRWNATAGGSDLQSALRILTATVFQVFANRTADLFLAEASGGSAKGFGQPQSLGPDSPQRVANGLKPGEIGPANLGIEVRNLANSTTAVPRYIILGRSGLPQGTDYCATPPDLPAKAMRGSVVIDFLSAEAANALPVTVRDRLVDPEGAPEFRDAARRLAALCPDDGSGLRHWVLTPDLTDSFRLIGDLETLAPYLFGGLQ